MSSIAGRLALVKMGGATTSFADEAVTVLTTNQIYQIANAAKQVWDPTATITVKAAGVAVDPVADPYVINRLTGTITFTNVSARGTVTVSGHYLPLSTIAKGHTVSVSLDAPALDDTTFDSNGWEECVPGMKAAAISLGRNLEIVSTPLLRAALTAGTPLVIEVLYNRNDATTAILMWGLATKQSANANIKQLITDGIDFVGYPDADMRVVSIA
jgi:hypothetical protein